MREDRQSRAHAEAEERVEQDRLSRAAAECAAAINSKMSSARVARKWSTERAQSHQGSRQLRTQILNIDSVNNSYILHITSRKNHRVLLDTVTREDVNSRSNSEFGTCEVLLEEGTRKQRTRVTSLISHFIETEPRLTRRFPINNLAASPRGNHGKLLVESQ